MTEPAVFADVPAIRALLAEAYLDDPLTAWIFPDPQTRRDACAAWYGLFVEQYATAARTTVVREHGRVVGAALWRLPDDPPLTSSGTPGIAGLLTALVGSAHATTVSAALHRIASVAPSGPVAYLNFLAVAADRRRSGLGRAVLGPLFAVARTYGLPVHLETTNPANYPFYEALGFVETGRLALGDGPLLRSLTRCAWSGTVQGW